MLTPAGFVIDSRAIKRVLTAKEGERTILDEETNCCLHDGIGSPPGHDAPEGNENAVGNSGGDAPQGNTNAVRHGGRCDPLKLYERLDGDDPDSEWIEELLATYIDRYSVVHEVDEEEVRRDDKLMDELRALATLSYQRELATLRTFEEGMVVPTEEDREIDGEMMTVRTQKLYPAERASL